MSKTKIFVDGDLLCFPAASVAEDRIYIAKDPYGKVVGEFTSASDHKNWLAEMEMMGFDRRFQFDGDVNDLTRELEIRPKDIKIAKRHFENTLDEWLSACPTGDVTVYLAPKSGQINPRHEIALRKPYKGNRKDTHKPIHLQAVRDWALDLPYTRKSYRFETDDLVAGNAQKHGENGYQISNEKDGLNSIGCWVYYPDLHEKPLFSDPNIVGYVEDDGKKLIGLGALHLLYQVLYGDKSDNYSGLDGAGKVKAYNTLAPFNNAPMTELPEVAKAVARLYKEKYGDVYKYVNKDGEDAVASWYDFYEESVRLAYMLKNRSDFPHQYLDPAKEML